MDELIRDRIHEALETEPTPPGLRVRVMTSIPINKRVARQPRLPSMRWAGQSYAGVVAVLLAIAIIAGLIYTRNAFAPQRTAPGTTYVASSARLINPDGVAAGPDGSVYVSDFLGDRVFQVLADGRLLTIAGGGVNGDGPATKAYLGHPTGLAIDRNGDLYIADNLGGTVRKVHPGRVATITTIVAARGASTNRTLNGPLGLAFDSAGALYIDDFNGEVLRLDPNGAISNLDISSLPPPGLNPAYMAFDSAGSLYVADQAPDQLGGNAFYPGPPGGGCRIVRIDPDRKLSVIAGTGRCGFSGDGGLATAAQLNNPDAIAFDSAGNIYLADSGNNRIRRIDKSGIITTVAGTGVAGETGDGGPATKAELTYPLGLAMAPGGRLYITDGCSSCGVAPGRLRLLRLSDGTIMTVADSRSPTLVPR